MKLDCIYIGTYVNRFEFSKHCKLILAALNAPEQIVLIDRTMSSAIAEIELAGEV